MVPSGPILSETGPNGNVTRVTSCEWDVSPAQSTETWQGFLLVMRQLLETLRRSTSVRYVGIWPVRVNLHAPTGLLTAVSLMNGS